MFELARERKVWWPVDLPNGIDEDDNVRTARVLVLFRIFTRKELSRTRLQLAEQMLTPKGRAVEEDPIEALAKREAETEQALRDRVLDWKRIVDEDGQAVPFGQEVLDVLIEHDGCYQALLQGLHEASRGAKAKNSSPGPGGAPAPAQGSRTTGYGTATNDSRR